MYTYAYIIRLFSHNRNRGSIRLHVTDFREKAQGSFHSESGNLTEKHQTEDGGEKKSNTFFFFAENECFFFSTA